MGKLILLYYPEPNWLREASRGWHRVPWSVWYLVPGLVEAGYEVKVYDHRVDNPREFEEALKRKPLFVGISTITGAPLRDAIRASKRIREVDPSIPILWGGWHSTILPEDCLKEDFIDLVAVGRGEETIIQIAKMLEGGSISQRIFIHDEKHYTFPKVIPYQNLDFTKYGPWFGYQTSTGCAWSCTFCAIHKMCGSKVFYKPTDIVVNELKYIVDHYPEQLVRITLEDDNFVMQKQSVIDFCEKWNNYGGIPLSVQAHANILVQYDDAMWKLLSKAGFSHIMVGAESGNETILKRVKKHQSVETLLRVAELMDKYDMMPDYSVITGFPDSEELGDFRDTITMLREAGRINPRLIFKIFWATPFPGTELYDWYVQQGEWVPKTMKQFSDHMVRVTPKCVSKEFNDMVNFFITTFQPKWKWNWHWDLFIEEFEKARSKGQIKYQEDV